MSDALGGGTAIRDALSIAVALLLVAAACLFAAARLLYEPGAAQRALAERPT
jgi:hypothetical protein